jgi:hypothetical protein
MAEFAGCYTVERLIIPPPLKEVETVKNIEIPIKDATPKYVLKVEAVNPEPAPPEVVITDEAFAKLSQGRSKEWWEGYQHLGQRMDNPYIKVGTGQQIVDWRDGWQLRFWGERP